MPSLQSIQLGDYALQGDGSDKQKMITEQPYNYRNTLTMRSEKECKLRINRSSFIDKTQRKCIQLHEYGFSGSGEYEFSVLII